MILELTFKDGNRLKVKMVGVVSTLEIDKKPVFYYQTYNRGKVMEHWHARDTVVKFEVRQGKPV